MNNFENLVIQSCGAEHEFKILQTLAHLVAQTYGAQDFQRASLDYRLSESPLVVQKTLAAG